ncbi:MAG: DUF1893 domain-containing protein [Clostridia bacterium]|nr:DUF1893 domain-containing protein [Clostridia bacterium]
MTDLQIAVKNLEGHTICLCKGGKCLYSESRGISPMMNFIADGVDLAGYSVADLIVGKAAALLFVKSGIKEVYAKTLSEGGKKVLGDNGVPVTYQTLTEKIINRAGTDTCPMEKAVANTANPEEAYALLKQTLSALKKG